MNSNRRWLPPHFRLEEKALMRHGSGGWPALAALSDGDLRALAADGSCSEARLRRLRGQARLMADLELAAPEAALLLHAGIADRQGLAAADPHTLQRQLGRLQRALMGGAQPPVALASVVAWIRRARMAPDSSRPTN